jgi:hypothetical protein
VLVWLLVVVQQQQQASLLKKPQALLARSLPEPALALLQTAQVAALAQEPVERQPPWDDLA